MSNKSRRWKSILTMLTLAALVATVYALRTQLGDTLHSLREANPWPILLVIPLTFLNNYSQAKVYQGLFGIFGDKFETRWLIRLSLELNLVNTVFPSGGVSGFSYLNLRSKEHGVTTGRSTFVQMLRIATIWVSFQILLGVGLLVLAVSGRANNFVMLLAGSLVTLLLVGTGGVAYIIGSQRRIHAFSKWLAVNLNRLIHLVRSNPETINLDKVNRALTELHECYILIRHKPGVLKSPMIYALLVSLCEISAIYSVFVAFGYVINPGAVIIAYAVACLGGVISVLPGGVGTYEGLMAGVFAASGVRAAVSLPVIIAYRVISMTLQLPLGYYFYQKALRAKPRV